MYAVFAGFSHLRNIENSLRDDSLIDKVGYFNLVSPTSRKPFVTTMPSAYSRKVMESSFFDRLYKPTGSFLGGIFTGSYVLKYFCGVVKNLRAFSTLENTKFLLSYLTRIMLFPTSIRSSSFRLTGQ